MWFQLEVKFAQADNLGDEIISIVFNLNACVFCFLISKKFIYVHRYLLKFC